jgi:O-antigen ligase
MGIFLMTAGIVLILIPLSCTSPSWIWGLGTLFILADSMSLMPKGSIGTSFGMPPWRLRLESLQAIHLPDQVTVDPLASLFWVVMLCASLVIAIYCLTSPLSSRAMERVALLALVGCSLYAVVAWIAWQTGWLYPFFIKESWAQPAFGFFSNRNQTAGFLLTGAILSLGLIHRGVNGGGMIAALLAGAVFAFLTAMLLFFSNSRGGLLFLMAGIVIWIAGLGKSSRPRGLIPAGAILFLFIGVLFLQSGSGLLERLKGHAVHEASLPGGALTEIDAASRTEGASSADPRDARDARDARIGIYLDTFCMIRDFPVTGTGPGTFAQVYPFYADKSLRDDTTALHAESDWLTLAAEAGLPALLVAFAGIAILLARIPRLRRMSGTHWPVRWAFLSACFAELLHGFVDVPLHKPELGWWIMLLGAVGFGYDQGTTPPRRTALHIQRIFFIIAGAGIVALGAFLIRAQWFDGESSPPFAPIEAQKRVTRLSSLGDDASLVQAIGECRRTIKSYPMAQPVYFQLGGLLLFAGDDSAVPEAVDLLAAGRALSPHDPRLAFEQGKLLLPVNPDATVELWQESLRRQLLLDRLPSCPIRRSSDLFGRILEVVGKDPDLLSKMPLLASLAQELRMVWLGNASCDPGQIAEAAEDEAFMNSLSVKEQGRVFELWSRRGDKSSVTAFLDAHPRYQRAAIQTKASLLAASGQPEQACRLLIDTFSIPMPSTKKDAGIIRAGESDVPSDPLEAARYYMERGNDLSARRLLGEALKSGGGGVGGRDALLLRAQLEVRAGNWKAALDSLISYLRATKQL